MSERRFSRDRSALSVFAPTWCLAALSGAGVVLRWCRGGAGVVPGWCRSGAGVVP